MSDVLLDIKDLRKYFQISRGFMRRNTGAVRAVDGVSLAVQKARRLEL